MIHPIQFTISAIETSQSQLSGRRHFTLFCLALIGVLLAFSPAARAIDPAPGGGYPNNNTALGAQALDKIGGANNGANNTALGYRTLFSDTTGSFNTATGSVALNSNSTGSSNTATGQAALNKNTTGSSNTATGVSALLSNTTGGNNTANGDTALGFNTAGNNNTANGVDALRGNSTGNNNTATGFTALQSNSTGLFNTASGVAALYSNTTGRYNSAEGGSALYSNSIGSYNTAAGFGALYKNATGAQNTATGVNALYRNVTGPNNTANGYGALFNNTGGNNIALGANAGSALTTGSNNIVIGNAGGAAQASTIRIGATQTRTFIAGIRGRTTGVANAVPVVIDTSGQLGTASSSRRFKHDIKPMDQTSEAILDLKPVTFHYNEDSSETAQFGLIAEEVAKVNRDLVVRDEDGKIYTVRYEAVNAMLLNEFLKQHRKVEKQEATIAELRSADAEQKAMVVEQQHEIKALAASLKEQATLFQKVSAQLAPATPALQLVGNQ